PEVCRRLKSFEVLVLEKLIIMFKKAARAYKSAGHVDLGMIIYYEKCVTESLAKVIAAKTEASNALLRWVRHEDNPWLKETVVRFAESNAIWASLNQDYIDQYEDYRKTFKEILQGEKQMDE
ncbi:unnamed protein product, partial [Owenia fusiformis]